MHELAPDEPPHQEVRRLVIELVADFGADAAPVLGLGFNFRGFDDLFEHGQIGRPARFIALAAFRARWGR